MEVVQPQPHQQQYQQAYPHQEKPAGHADQYGQSYPQQHHDPISPATAQSQYHGHYGGAAPAKSSGTKRGLLIGLIIAIVLLLATIIGLAAGLGVSQNHLHSAQSDLFAAQASLSSAVSSASTTPSATSSSSASATKTSSSATATATTDSFSTCPGSNGTIYASGTDSKKFTVRCGIDYSGDEADDLNSTKAATMSECMDACAKLDQCAGAGWGYVDNYGNMCYMKANLTTYHNATANWEFATLNLDS